jgi:hypothetical protein
MEDSPFERFTLSCFQSFAKKYPPALCNRDVPRRGEGKLTPQASYPILAIVKHKYFIAFTLLYFILGLFLYKDFGATHDERVEYDVGKYLLTYYKTPTTSSYLIELSTTNPNNIHRAELPIFSDYSRVYPMLLNVFNPNNYLEWFHLQNIFYGYFLFLFSYILYYLVYKKPSVAVLGPVFLFLTSLVTGHIPANPKDIPFATIMLLGVLGIYFFTSRVPRTQRQEQKHSSDTYLLLEVISLGVIFGVAQSLRAVGLTLFIGYFVLGLLSSSSLKDAWLLLLKSMVIGFISLIIWVISVPFIGANVITNITGVFFNAAGFRWNREVLYFGEFLYKQERPWHYLFVYLLIQLPLFTLFGLSAGVGSTLTKKLKYSKSHPALLLLFLTAATLLLYLVLHPVIYNGIRHFLYIVVFLTLLGGFALIDLYKTLSKKNKLLLKVVTGSYCLFTLVRMVGLHPYQYVYYNELVGGLRGAQGQFELDYWGATYKEATEYVGSRVDLHNLKDLQVSACNQHFGVDYFSRFKFKRLDSSEGADVIICSSFEVLLREESGQEPFTETHPLVKTISREGVPIHYIYARPGLVELF